MTAPDISRSDWLTRRVSGIGSSDAAAACGESKTSPAELVMQKRGVMKPEDLSHIEAVLLGNVFEPVIVSMTAARKGLRLLDPVLDRAVMEREIEGSGETEVVGWIDGRQAFLRSVSRPWQLAAIDGICMDEHAGLIAIEAKNVGGYHSRDWDPELGTAPAKFDVQVAHQLAVAPAFTAAYLSAIVGGNSLRVLCRERVKMEATIQAVISIEAEVWRCVEDGCIPAFDGSESHVRAIRALHPEDSGEQIVLSDDAMGWHRQLIDLQAGHSGVSRLIKDLRLKIEAAMDGATYGVLPDGSGRYSNLRQVRREFTVPSATFTVLRFTRNKT